MNDSPDKEEHPSIDNANRRQIKAILYASAAFFILLGILGMIFSERASELTGLGETARYFSIAMFCVGIFDLIIFSIMFNKGEKNND